MTAPTASAPDGLVSAPERFWSYLKQKELDFFPSGALRWWLLALIVFAWAIEQFERLKIGPVLVFVFDEFGVGLMQWGVVGAVAAVVQAIGAYVLSNLADRYGRRPVIIWPVFLYLVIAAGSALAPTFLTLAVLYVLGGFIVSGMSPAVHAASRDITPQMGRGMGYAWISLAWTVGALMATWIAARTLPVWPGWRPQFWIAAVFAGFTVVLLVLFYRDLSMKVRTQIVHDQLDAMKAGTRAAGDVDLTDASSGNLIYRDLRMWLLCGTMLFWGIAYGTLSFYLPTYLIQHYSIDAAAASSLSSYFWLVFTFSIFFSGWLSDRLRTRKTITAFGGIATGLCMFWAVSLELGTSFGTLALAWSVAGFFAGFIYPSWCAIVSENAEEISPFGVARAFGIMFVLGAFSGPALSLSLPRIVAAFGWPGWMRLCATSCLMIAVLVAFGRGPWLPRGRARGGESVEGY